MNSSDKIQSRLPFPSVSEDDSLPQIPAKRPKTSRTFMLNELDLFKQGRRDTFSHSPFSQSFRSRLTEAGFAYCNVHDRVICIYCDLICHQWKIELDDPCEVHKTCSPNCPLVKSMSCHHPWQYYDIVPTLPTHAEYIYPEKRLASFATWSNPAFPSVDTLVHAGFFYTGSKIVCFCCNGSFENCDLNNHLIAEHIRWFPQCNYVRQLCGEELYYKIQQSLSLENISVDKSNSVRSPLHIIDDNTISKLVAARLDLPELINLSNNKGIPRATIEHCLKKQFELKGNDFANIYDLYIACIIYQKQIELIQEKRQNIIIPSIALRRVYEQTQRLPLNGLNQSYSDILKSFENDLQTYQNAQQVKFQHSIENESMAIKRERSINIWSNDKSSPHDMFKGGWFMSDTKSDIVQCLYCHMQYANWTLTDNPFLIHRYLSPFCPFVLSSNPLNESSIAIKQVREQFTDEVIENAATIPYDGLAQVKYDSVLPITTRSMSFNELPINNRLNCDKLAKYGFFYRHHDRSIQCVYCKHRILISSHISHSDRLIKKTHISRQCRYLQQMNDKDPIVSRHKVSTNKCIWCKTEDKCLLALPCRHLSLCKSCGEVKRLCPKCNERVKIYVTIYLS